MKKVGFLRSVVSIAMFSLGACSFASAQDGQVNLYTTREPGLIKPLLEAFTKASGVKVNAIFFKDGMAERVAAEGSRSPADVLMTVDIGNLIDLLDRNVTQPVKSPALEAAIPANLRAADGSWFTLATRARIVYAAKNLSLDALNYENLADPAWKGKICIRSGQHPYNTALTAAYIAHHGVEKAEAWLRGVKANLARKPGGGDREVARDILGGLCQIGVGNSYYVGIMRSGQGGADQKAWGEAVKAILPTFEGGGTQVNISGASVAKFAPNKENAIKLLEYLVSDEAQKLYASHDFEYPVKAGAPIDPIIQSLGALKVDPMPLADIVKHRKTASELMDKVGFDN